MSWVYLILAIGLEVSATTCMKLSQGFSRSGPSMLTFVFYGLSIVSLTMAVKRLHISVSYAVWSGLGTPEPSSTVRRTPSTAPRATAISPGSCGSRPRSSSSTRIPPPRASTA